MNSATRVSSPGGLLVSIRMSALSSSLVSRSTSATTAGSMPAMSSHLRAPQYSRDGDRSASATIRRPRLPRAAVRFRARDGCGIVSLPRGEVAEWLKATAC